MTCRNLTINVDIKRGLYLDISSLCEATGSDGTDPKYMVAEKLAVE